MIKYKVGYNFDNSLVGFIDQINQRTIDAQIDSVYASIAMANKLTARPKYKLPDLSIDELEKHIDAIHKIGVKFIYPLNASYIGSKNDIDSKAKEIIEFANNLQNIGVDGVIVSHPIIADLIHKNTNLELSYSSIANIFSANQIGLLNEKFACHSYCLSPYFNRKIKSLKEIQNRCSKIDCNIELIVNELCGLGYSNGSFSPCVYRDACFDFHSENETAADENLLDGFPQRLCMANRRSFGPEFWAKTMVIRPEDIKKYATQLGIVRFKITGRTATTEDLCKVIKAYMQFSYKGDLSHLWYMKDKSPTVNNSLLEGLIDHWFENENFSCDNELCGVTCSYCDNYVHFK